jgi:hypothetical protein
MGWRIKALLVALTALMVTLLILSVTSLVAPEFEDLALLFVATLGINLFIGVFALILTGNKSR